ncbi:serine/arginine repetitive matrix protein 1-like [Oryctolagus cuniculus]|uniref:serine/arginine repetitive matrix protein 1-like n=1 Tax=Oryctolagus cuniculus TaxID=9986 RepID=UPI00387986A6
MRRRSGSGRRDVLKGLIISNMMRLGPAGCAHYRPTRPPTTPLQQDFNSRHTQACKTETTTPRTTHGRAGNFLLPSLEVWTGPRRQVRVHCEACPAPISPPGPSRAGEATRTRNSILRLHGSGRQLTPGAWWCSNTKRLDRANPTAPRSETGDPGRTRARSRQSSLAPTSPPATPQQSFQPTKPARVRVPSSRFPLPRGAGVGVGAQSKPHTLHAPSRPRTQLPLSRQPASELDFHPEQRKKKKKKPDRHFPSQQKWPPKSPCQGHREEGAEQPETRTCGGGAHGRRQAKGDRRAGLGGRRGRPAAPRGRRGSQGGCPGPRPPPPPPQKVNTHSVSQLRRPRRPPAGPARALGTRRRRPEPVPGLRAPRRPEAPAPRRPLSLSPSVSLSEGVLPGRR